MENNSVAKIIALAAEKGGVGKTTMGAHTYTPCLKSKPRCWLSTPAPKAISLLLLGLLAARQKNPVLSICLTGNALSQF